MVENAEETMEYANAHLVGWADSVPKVCMHLCKKLYLFKYNSEFPGKKYLKINNNIFIWVRICIKMIKN